MLEDVLDIPNHIRDALWRADSAQLKARPSSGFVVCGMGGSAIGAELARTLLDKQLTGPMVVPQLRSAQVGHRGLGGACLLIFR